MSKQDNRLRRVIIVVVALVAMTAPGWGAASAEPGSAATLARVHGGGSGVLIDPDGNSFPLDSFRVRGVVKDDGSATGGIHFVWRGAFPQAWGDPACEGTCDTVVLKGEVETGTVAADGTVTLSGTARELDKRRGEVVFDSDFDEPFSIVVGGSRPKNSFVLQWCELPAFDITGHIRTTTISATTHDNHEDGMSLASARSLDAPCAQRAIEV